MRSHVAFIGAALFALTLPTTAAAAKPDPSGLDYFTGTWHCVGKNTMRKGQHPFTLAYSYDLNHTWQKQVTTGRTSGLGYATYDAAAKHFIFIGLDASGDYGMSTSPGWVGNTLTITDTNDSQGNLGVLKVVKAGPSSTTYSYTGHSKAGKTYSGSGACTKV
jgi:hypothetical protein